MKLRVLAIGLLTAVVTLSGCEYDVLGFGDTHYWVSVRGVVTDDGMPISDVVVRVTSTLSPKQRLTDPIGLYQVDLSETITSVCWGVEIEFLHPDGRSEKIAVPGGCGTHTIDYDFK